MSVLAAADKDNSANVNSLIYLLCTVVYWFRNKELSDKVVAKLPKWYNESVPLFKELGLKTKTLHSLFVNMSAGRSPRPKDSVALDELDVQLAKARVKAENDVNIPRDLVGMFVTLRTQVRTSSDSSWNTLSLKLKKMNDPTINSMWFAIDHDDIPDHGPAYDKIKKIATKVTGDPKAGHTIPKEYKEDLEPHKEKWAAARKEYSEIFMQHVQRIFAESGKTLLPLSQVRKGLAQVGIKPEFKLPLKGGDTLKVDIKLSFYTPQGEAMEPLGGPGTVVEMNPNYDPKENNYVCIVSGGGRENEGQVYTLRRRAERADKMAKDVDGAEKSLPKARKAWQNDMINGDEPECTLGLMAQTIYDLAIRCGAPGNATDGKATTGLTTLKVKNIKEQADGSVKIRFVGKSGVNQLYWIKPINRMRQAQLKEFKNLLKGKDPKDWFFTYKGKRITENTFRQYLTSKGFKGTPKTFRTMKGTIMAREILEATPYKAAVRGTMKAKQDKAEKWFKDKVLLPVAKALGHKKASGEALLTTCAKSYISLPISHGFFKEAGVRLPSWIPSSASKE